MRNLKKLVALIVTIALMASFAIPAFAAVPPDVKGTDYEGAVTRLQALGVINGYPNGDFGPNDSITRAQFAAVVVRALGYEEVAATAKGVTKFSDVPATHWAAGYINLATSLGIINGYPDGKFGPDDKVLFEQSVAMIVRALGQGALAENKGGYPSGYLVQAKGIGFTNGVAGVAGVPANRGIVALLIDNAKAKPIYYQEGIGDTQIYKPAVDANGNATDSFVIRLGINLRADDKIVTKTPASAGLDANTFVAGDVTYTAIEGAVDVESLLGKKVDLWGSANDKIVLAENVVGTSVAIKTVDDVDVDDKGTVSVADDVYSIDTTLADGTDKVYTVVAGAAAFKDLQAKGLVAAAEDVAGVAADLVQISAVVDGDNIQFLNAVEFTQSQKLTTDPVENKVQKFIRIFGSFYIKHSDKAAKKVVIEKDGAIVDWTALKSGDVLFIAGSGDTSPADNYIYIKATSKTATGTLEAYKGTSWAAATSIRVEGTWYEVSALKATSLLSAINDKKGGEVTVSLDPVGKAYSLDGAGVASTDKYGVVLGSEIATSLGDTVYKVKLLTSTGDKIVYTVANNDNTEDYIVDFGDTDLVGDLVSYHIGTDGNIDTIKVESTSGAGLDTFDTSRLVLKDTTPATAVSKAVSSDVVIFYENAGAYSKIALSDIKDDQAVAVISYVDDGSKIVAVILDTYAPASTDAAYAYVSEFIGTNDGYTVDVFTKDGLKSYDTTTYTPAAGALVKYTLDSSNKLSVSATETVDVNDKAIEAVDATTIKVNDVTYWFADNALVIFDEAPAGSAEALTIDDLYADMVVDLYLNTDGDVVAVVISAM